jgi:hypothetical protein
MIVSALANNFAVYLSASDWHYLLEREMQIEVEE